MDNNKKTYDIDEIKPRKWLLVILIIIALGIIVLITNKIIVDMQNRRSNSNNFFSNFFNFNSETFDETKSQVEDTIKNAKTDSFNFEFEAAVGTKYGINVLNLLDRIITNNKKDETHQITVVYNETSTADVEIIKNLKANFSEWSKYEISADYDENKYINKITIENK